MSHIHHDFWFMYVDWLFLQGFDPGDLPGEESDDSDDEGKYLFSTYICDSDFCTTSLTSHFATYYLSVITRSC